MKPGDHPEFFRFPPPEGRSRESSIRLDEQGRFWHEGHLIEHLGMARAFASWIDRHPDDGRFILNNGFDWTYFEVEDAPFFVLGVRDRAGSPWLSLSDGTSEELDPNTLAVGAREALYTRVRRGKFVARFTPVAQIELSPWLAVGPNGGLSLEIAQKHYPIANACMGS